MKRPNLINQRFGRLTVVESVDCKPRAKWLCVCDCGRTTTLHTHRLTSGNTRSCGCYKAELAAFRKTKHGCAAKGCATTEYHTWAGMIQRCTNKSHASFRNYGGRGIGVCERWMKFENFLLDMGAKPGKEYSIERINNQLDYSKNNCKWEIRSNQARNTRRNVLLTVGTRTQCLKDWATEIGISQAALRERIAKHGPQQAINMNRQKNRQYAHDGKALTAKQWAIEIGVAHSTMRQRLRNLPIEEALNPLLIRGRH